MNEASSKFGGAITAIKTFLYGMFFFLDIDVDTVKILAILMAVDTVLGIIKSLKLKNKFTFKVLIWGLISKATILIVPMVLALTAKALSFDFTWFVTAVLNILVLSETFSSITNIISIKEGKELENHDFITRMLHAVRNGIGKLIEGLFTKIDKK